ncbi:MAG TPA: hypothetical protein VN772_03740 [Solirubrobacteraceae bacterium]|nr:hypothetical protein [Solirubrobacteraceae bacterium]
MSQRPHNETELIELIRSIEEPAPAALHERVQALVAERGSARRRRRLPTFELPARGALGAAAATAAVAVLLVVVLSGGGSGSSSSLSAASTLTLGQPTGSAPAESVANRGELTAAVDGVAFPYWEESFGWRAVGQRSDRVGGRAVTTVFYANDRGQRIGYAIVAGTPPPSLSGGAVAWRTNTAYHLLHLNGAQVIAWTRGGRLCVVSGRGVDSKTLLRLASWDDRGAVAA